MNFNPTKVYLSPKLVANSKLFANVYYDESPGDLKRHYPLFKRYDVRFHTEDSSIIVGVPYEKLSSFISLFSEKGLKKEDVKVVIPKHCCKPFHFYSLSVNSTNHFNISVNYLLTNLLYNRTDWDLLHCVVRHTVTGETMADIKEEIMLAGLDGGLSVRDISVNELEVFETALGQHWIVKKIRKQFLEEAKRKKVEYDEL